MINRLLAFLFQNRFLSFLLLGIVLIASVGAMLKTPVDALPDLSENQVIVVTQWPGQSPQNIEDQITYPLTVGMQGLPQVKTVRSSSMLGVSMVTVVFEDQTDIYFARDRVAQRLNVLRPQLPENVSPFLGPDATGIGQVFMYTLENPDMTLTQLRSLQDFTVKYELQSLPGVAEIASIGGHIKTYQVLIDPLKLSEYGVSLEKVSQQIKKSNNNVSGKILEYGEREISVQGIGFFENPKEIEFLVLGEKPDGSPLLISDIASVRLGGQTRRGILADSQQERVGGIVVMRYGENPLQVIDHVKEKIQTLQKSLPQGTSIVPFYDRTELIQSSIITLRNILIQMIIITAGVLFVFLLHIRSTFVAVLGLTLGVLLTFLFMRIFNIPSNIMSLGGIAIAIGTLVDSIIVVTENAYQKLLPFTRPDFKKRLQIVLASTQEVAGALIFAVLIICLSFVPIFSLQGMEGKLFSPLAFTNIFAMMGGLLASLFLVPLLCVYFLKGRLRRDKDIPLVSWFQKIYQVLLQKALQMKKIVFGVLAVLVGITVFAGFQIGSEFMPPLDEGSIMYMPMTVPDVSEKKAGELLLRTNKIFESFPEVENVVGKAGRADTATDPAPLAMIETFITLKPKSKWREGMTKDKLLSQMNQKINIPHLWNGFTQPIIGRIDMISTGIRSQVGIKIFGPDPQKLEELALRVEEMMLQVPGATGVVAIRTSGLKYLNIDIEEQKLALYDIPKSQVLDLIQTGTGGRVVSNTIQGRERSAIEVRFQNDFRDSFEDFQSLTVATKNGTPVPLSQIADIQVQNGPAVLHSENAKLRSAVQMDVNGRDLGSFIAESKTHLEKNLKLPAGYSWEFDGQYKNQIRASQRLSIVIPVVLLLIFLLLYIAYKDLGLVSIVMVAIPLSLIGGIGALFLADYNFSVAVWVGFIALFGNAVETGMVIILYLENTLKEFLQTHQKANSSFLHRAILEGATRRLRPILMTAFTSVLGLLPMIFSTGTGAEIQKPLAIVVIGGLVTSIVSTLFVIPLLFDMLREKTLYKN